MAKRQAPPAQTTTGIVTNDTSSNLKHVEFLPNVTIEEESHVTIEEESPNATIELPNVTIEESSSVTIEEESPDVTIELPNVTIEESPSVTVKKSKKQAPEAKDNSSDTPLSPSPSPVNRPVKSGIKPNAAAGTKAQPANNTISSGDTSFDPVLSATKVKGSKKRQREKKKKNRTTDDGIYAPPVLAPFTYPRNRYDAPFVLTAQEDRAYKHAQQLKASGYFHYVHTFATSPEAAPTLDGSEPSTPKPHAPAPRRITPQTPRMSRLEKEAAKNARNTPKAVSISPTFLPQVVEADQTLTAGISPVPDPREPTILSQVVEAGDARGAAMPPVTPKPTLSPLEAVSPTQVPLTGAQITDANTFRDRLLSAARLSRYQQSLDSPKLPISKAMALNLAAGTSITNTTTSSRHGCLRERNLDALSYATRKLSTLTAIKDARILAIHVFVARRVSQTAPSVLRTSAVQELNSHLLFISEDRLTPFSSDKLLNHLRRTVPASLNLGEPGPSAKKPARKRTQASDSIRLYRAAKRQVKAATLNHIHLLETQKRLTATKDGPFMVPGSPPPVLAVPFVPPSWAAIMTGGFRHYRIWCKLRTCHPYSRKETRRANRRDKETRRANLRDKTPRSCAGFVPEVVGTSDVRGATLAPSHSRTDHLPA